MNTEQLTCNACGWTGNDPTVESSGPHWKASCPQCGRYIKMLLQGGVPMLYFGKYKGIAIADVAKTDPAYLRWLKDETKNAKLRQQIETALL